MNRLLPALCTALLLAACIPPQQNAAPVPPAPASTSAPAGESDTSAASTSTGTVIVQERLLASGIIESGDAAAPVSLLIFTNHACTYCRMFHDELLPRLNNEFVRTGKLRVGIIPFALLKYADSDETASLLLCAARQNKGMAMHSLLFRTNASSRTFGEEVTALGMNHAELQTCTQDGGIRATLAAQQSVAHSLGVSLVPTYFVNGRMFLGQPDYADLRGQIEEALTE